MNFIDPKSERGQELIRESATVEPTTQGDPPPQNKPGRWSRFLNGLGEAIGEFMFGGNR